MGRSRGLCMSLIAPKPPVHLWEPAFCRRHHLEQKVEASNQFGDNRVATMNAINVASLDPGYQTVGQKFLGALDKVSDAGSECTGIHTGRKSSRKSSFLGEVRKMSKQFHTDLGHQPPNHAHMHLMTKHDKTHGHRKMHGDPDLHIARHGSRLPSKSLLSHSASSPALGMEDGTPHHVTSASLLMPPDLPSSPTHGNLRTNTVERTSLVIPDSLLGMPARAKSRGSLTQFSARGSDDSGSMWSDKDLHHLDPALDDQQVCRIGTEVRHVQPTGFLHPMKMSKRLGICT